MAWDAEATELAPRARSEEHVSIREIAYGLLAIVGVVWPWNYNLVWMQTSDAPSLPSFFAEGFTTPATSSLTVDLFIACTTFFVWMLVEARRLKMRWAWLLIPYALMIAFASAFPLFLLWRERVLRRAEAS